jgi:hypothetical protein
LRALHADTVPTTANKAPAAMRLPDWKGLARQEEDGASKKIRNFLRSAPRPKGANRPNRLGTYSTHPFCQRGKLVLDPASRCGIRA